MANTSLQIKTADAILEDDVLKYCLIPSLQQVSMCSIIITLWNQEDIKHKIGKLYNVYKYYYPIKCTDKLCQKIGITVLNKLQKLILPCRIRKILSNIVHPTGKEIFDWIEYQDAYIFCNAITWDQGLESRAVHYLDNLVWATRGVIDYKETAKSLIVKEKNLSDIYRYNIASAYCLEDSVESFASKVVDTALVQNSIERQAMVFFWTAHITRNFTELDKAVHCYNRKNYKNYGRNECLFEILLDNHTNQIAIKYIWNLLSNEEKSSQIVSAITKTSNMEIRCFLLSQISKDQEREVFQSSALRILRGFLEDWLWGQYFLPTIHHIWDMLPRLDYLELLKIIVDRMETNHEDTEQYKYIFKEMWQCAPENLKEFVFGCGNGNSGRSIFFELFNKKNMDIIQLILADIDDVQKMQIIFSDTGIEKCYVYLTSNQWDLLNILIVHTLFSTAELKCLKQVIIIKKGRNIAAHFIHNKEWEKIERFLQFIFESEEDIKKFKSQLAYSEICLDILESSLVNDRLDFIELEYFLKWCASDNAEKVVELKKELPRQYFALICTLIEKEECGMLDEILNWCFTYDQKQTARYKHNFCYNIDNFDIVMLVFKLIKKDDQLQSFDKFLHWCFINEEDISKFKTFILHPIEHKISVCKKLLCENMFKMADEFVNYCCNSSQSQIDSFKNKLLIHYGILSYSEGKDPVTFYETKVIRWYNPSIETIIRFKEKFINSWHFNKVSSALENYIKEQEKNQGNVINKDLNNILQDLRSAVANQEHGIIH